MDGEYAGMNEEPRRRASASDIIAFGLSGAIVLVAATLFVLNMGKLRDPAPGQKLTDTLTQHFPESQPKVSRQEDTLVIELQVDFDPTIDVELGQKTLDRVRTLADEAAVQGLDSIEVALTGMSGEGTVTSVSRTFDYEPVDG